MADQGRGRGARQPDWIRVPLEQRRHGRHEEHHQKGTYVAPARRTKLVGCAEKMAKKLHINNAQYAVLEASEDFMKTALILVSGVVTDRIGGASKFAQDTFTDKKNSSSDACRRHALGKCHL